MRQLTSKLYTLLILISCFSSISCNSTPDKEIKEPVLLNADNEKVMGADKTKIYNFNEGCVETFKKIDFSSLCFTDEHTPPYSTGDMSFMKNRCQYTLADGQIKLGIVFKDYSTTKPEEVNDRLNSERKAYMMTEKLMYKNIQIIEDFKYSAVISENSLADSNVKKLTIFFNNIVIFIEADKNNCAATNDSLLKTGQIVLESVIE